MNYSLIKKFSESSRGQFALSTALLMFPVMAGVVMTVEYSNLSDNQARLQNAVDAAALYVGQYALEHGEMPKMRRVRAFLRENFDGEITAIDVDGSKESSDEYSVRAVSRVPRYFLSGVSPQAYYQTATAIVPKGEPVDVAVALVLDSTGSMNQSVSEGSQEPKLDVLKRIATSFIDKQSVESDNLASFKAAIVPFSYYVNVGVSNRDEFWVQDGLYEYSSTLSTEFDGQELPYEIVYRRDQDDGYLGRYEVTYRADGVGDWTGCVGSRADPNTFTDTTPYDPFPRIIEVASRCPQAITPLSDDWAALRTDIDTIEAAGHTYMAPGVMWGLRVLSDHEPFSEAVDLDDPERIMVIMADGDNDRSHSLAFGHPLHLDQRMSGNEAHSSDDYTKAACQEARDQGVIIYTIAFGASVTETGREVLQACASNPFSHYFEALDSDDLQNVFDRIADNVTRLRLTG